MATPDSEPLLRGSLDRTKRVLLESAADDAPDPRARDRMLAALAAAPAPSESGGRLRWLRRGGHSVYGTGVVFVLAAGAALWGVASWTSHSTSTGEAGVVGAPPPGTEPTRDAVPPPSPSETAASAIPLVTPDALPSASALERRRRVKHGAPGRVEAPAPGPEVEPEAHGSSLAREIAQVEAARTSLAAGDSARTLAILDRYDREFPSGAFAVEVAVLRIEALARAGRTDDARRLGTRFLAAHRQGAFARRVAITLEAMSAPVTRTPPSDPRSE